MNDIKILEIRDRGTYIPALAIPCGGPKTSLEAYHFKMAGFSAESPEIILVRLDPVEANWDPFKWNSRTMREAHWWIYNNWTNIPFGAVVDVQYFLGESNKPKQSQYFSSDEYKKYLEGMIQEVKEKVKQRPKNDIDIVE